MHWYRDKVFPWLMSKNIGKRSILALRRKVIANANGRILEIGIGGGLNLTLYPKEVCQITTVDNYVRQINHSGIAVDIIHASSDNLPFDNNSFDTVVSTFSLCSMWNLEQVLGEIYRVLEPDGQFIFLEHGKAKNKFAIMLQNICNPLYNTFAYGCNINRQYQKELTACGFKLIEFNYKRAPIYPRILTGYVYYGVAKKPIEGEEYEKIDT